jgi:hypothetical protein
MGQRKTGSALERIQRLQTEARPASEKQPTSSPQPEAAALDQAPAQDPAQTQVQLHAQAPAHDALQPHVQVHAQAHVQGIVHPHAQAHVQPVVQGHAQADAQALVAVPQRPLPKARLHVLVEQDQKRLISDLATMQGVEDAVIVRHMIEHYRATGPLMQKLREILGRL